MKTKHWDIEADLAQRGVVEADLAQNEGSWIKFNINRGGGGHVYKSKHENGRGRVKSSLFLSSLGLFATRRAFLFFCWGVVLLTPPLLPVLITLTRDDDEKGQTSRRQ